MQIPLPEPGGFPFSRDLPDWTSEVSQRWDTVLFLMDPWGAEGKEGVCLRSHSHRRVWFGPCLKIDSWTFLFFFPMAGKWAEEVWGSTTGLGWASTREGLWDLHWETAPRPLWGWTYPPLWKGEAWQHLIVSDGQSCISGLNWADPKARLGRAWRNLGNGRCPCPWSWNWVGFKIPGYFNHSQLADKSLSHGRLAKSMRWGWWWTSMATTGATPLWPSPTNRRPRMQ